MLNQPTSTICTNVTVAELMEQCCIQPVLTLTAFNTDASAELKLLWLDMTTDMYETDGKIQIGLPNVNTKTKMFEVKDLGKVFKEYEVTEKGIILTEIGNDANMVAANGAITAATTWTFSDVTGLMAGDKVLIIQSDSSNATVTAQVKITAVDTDTDELTFSTAVTIADGDYIKYLSSDQAWCNPVTKAVSTSFSWGKELTFYYQIFARTFDIKVADMNKCFMKDSKQSENFLFRTMNAADQEIWESASRQFRYGLNISGASSETMGYDTMIVQREANNLSSVIDFTADTTAAEFNDRIMEVWTRSQLAPIKSKKIMLMNQAFFNAYKKVHAQLFADNSVNCVTMNKCDTLFYWLIKYETEDFSLPEMYLSQSLTQDSPAVPVAYILPADLIALFIPPVVDVAYQGTPKQYPNEVGKMIVNELPTSNIGCKSYNKYMTLGYLFGWFSFRDTYFKLTNFDYAWE